MNNPNLKPYPNYKPSGVEWLGDVPAHWEVLPLKRWLGMNESVLSDATNPNFEFRYIDIGLVGTGVLIEKPQKIRFATAPSRARRIVREGDTIISTVRTYLKAVWFAEDIKDNSICSTGFTVLTPRQRTSPKFVSYLTQNNAFIDRVTANSIGTAYPAITESRLGSFQVAIPPLSEQTAIVRYLDQADERIRRYISIRKRLIELLEEYRQTVIHHAVTRGLDPDVRLKPSGIEWLGDVPAHWETKRLKTIGRIRYGLGQPPRELADGLPLIRATNVDHGRIIDKNLLYIDPLDVPSGRDAILREKEIIVVRSGAYTGDSAIIPKAYDGAVTGYDMVVSVTGAQPEFVAMALLCKYVRDDQLIVASTRSAQPHLNAEELGTAILLVPPLHEQAAIVTYLDKATADIDAAIDRARREIELLGEYRTRLIADVVTGKVDVREAVVDLPQ